MSDSIEDRLDHFTIRLSAIEAQARRTDLLSDAFGIVHGIVEDLVKANELDMSEYEEDLDRLSELEHLLL